MSNEPLAITNYQLPIINYQLPITNYQLQNVMSSDELISREEVLEGLPAKRANTLLFLIESRTAQIVARSRVEFSLTSQAANERDLAFLEAFALGNAPPLHPTIQQLERYANQWLPLVPENPRLKAAIAHALGEKYTFTYQVVPHIRASLCLDEKAVQVAFSRLYRRQLARIFASKLSLIEQWRWKWMATQECIESLPPFWLASLITVALGLPQAFLALPIAVADIGPLATVGFVVIIGTINILTMACMAEAVGRSGDFRYGNPFIKQLAANYLGNAGSFILSLAVAIRVFLIALACYIGLSATMANFTHIPAALWAVLLFWAGLYLLSRPSLNFTVAVMVLLAAINVSLLLVLSLLAFRHVQLENLLYINLPFLNGHFQPWMLERILGVSLMLYFGHVYVGECAKLILPRDPSASSLIWGSVAGTGFLTILFCIWVLAVNGAVAPQLLAGQSGTILEPLAQQVGSIVPVLGTVLVTLLLGMAWLRSSSLLINLTREWLPSRPHPVLMLPRHQGTLILHPRGNPSRVPHLGITYLGLEKNQPKFRLDIQLSGNIHQVEITVIEHWEIKQLFEQFPDLHKWDTRLTLQVQSANQDSACLQVTSPMVLAYEGKLKSEVNNTVRKQECQTIRSFWTALVQERHFLLSISPLVLVLLITEWLFLNGIQSFTGVLAFAGVLGNTLVGGIFPVLLLVSSRQKGELMPGVVFQILNHPFFSIGIYSLFLAILFVHGLFIWENSLARIGALCIAGVSLGATLVMKRSGAFAARIVVELAADRHPGGQFVFTITTGGQPKIAEVRLGYDSGEELYQAAKVEIPSLESLRYAIFHLPTHQEKELRVWAHKNNSSGDSKSLPALVEIENGNKNMQFDLKLSGGRVLLPLISNAYRLKIAFPEPSSS